MTAEKALGKRYQERKDKSVFYREATFYSAAEVVEMMKGTGFADFAFTQTLFRPLAEIREVEPVRDGYGDGAFVAIRGGRRRSDL